MLCKRIDEARDGMRERLEEIKGWRDAYEGIIYPIDRDADEFGDRAEVWVPLTRWMVDSFHARIYRVILAPTPLFDADANQAGGPGTVSPDAIRRIQQAADYDFRVRMNLRGVLDESLLNACIDGNCIVRHDYVREFASFVRPVVVTPELRASGVQGLEDYADGAIADVEFPGDRIRDHSRLTPVPMEDWILWPHDHPDIDTAPMKGERLILTTQELLLGVENGLYDKAAVKRLLSEADPVDMGDDDRGGDSDRLVDIAFQPADATRDSESEERYGARWEVWMLVCQYQTQGKDRPYRDCLFLVEKSKGILLAGGVFPHELPVGESWYTNFCPFKRKGTWVGYSIAEILRDIQDMMTDVFNQNLDAGAISNLILFGKKAGTKLNLQAQRYYQADFIEVDNPNAIWRIDTGNTDRAGARVDYESLKQMAEEVLGLSPYQQGQAGKGDTTLGEIQAVISEGNERLRVPIDRICDSATRLANQWILYRYQYMDRDLMFRLAGNEMPGSAPEYDVLTLEDLETQCRLSLRSKPELADPRLAIQKAEKLVMLASSSPAMQTPEAIYNVNAEAIKAFGYPNVTDFLGSREAFIARAEQAKQAPPPLPEGITMRADEVTTLAFALRSFDPEYSGATFPELMEAAAHLAALTQSIILPPVVGATMQDAPDDAPGATPKRISGTGRIENVGQNGRPSPNGKSSSSGGSR